MTAADWPAVEEIYAQGIEDGEATFEVATPTWEAFDAGKLAGLRLVAVDEGTRRRMGCGLPRLNAPRVPRRGRALRLHRSRGSRAGFGRLLLDAFIDGRR